MNEIKNILRVKLFSAVFIFASAFFSVSCNSGGDSATVSKFATSGSLRAIIYPLSWKLLYKDNASINVLAVFTPNILYVGDSRGCVGRIIGNNYTDIWCAIDQNDIISGVAIDANANVYFTRDAQLGGDIYSFAASDMNYVSHVTNLADHPTTIGVSSNGSYMLIGNDYGDLFTNGGAKVNNALPSATINTVNIDNNNNLYAGSSEVYYTAAGSGWVWQTINTNPATAAIIDENNNAYIATMANGNSMITEYNNGNLITTLSSPPIHNTYNFPNILSLGWDNTSNQLFAGSGACSFFSDFINGDCISQGNDLWVWNGSDWTSTGLGAIDSYDVNAVAIRYGNIYVALSDGSVYMAQIDS